VHGKGRKHVTCSRVPAPARCATLGQACCLVLHMPQVGAAARPGAPAHQAVDEVVSGLKKGSPGAPARTLLDSSLKGASTWADNPSCG